MYPKMFNNSLAQSARHRRRHENFTSEKETDCLRNILVDLLISFKKELRSRWWWRSSAATAVKSMRKTERFFEQKETDRTTATNRGQQPEIRRQREREKKKRYRSWIAVAKDIRRDSRIEHDRKNGEPSSEPRSSHLTTQCYFCQITVHKSVDVVDAIIKHDGMVFLRFSVWSLDCDDRHDLSS